MSEILLLTHVKPGATRIRRGFSDLDLLSLPLYPKSAIMTYVGLVSKRVLVNTAAGVLWNFNTSAE